MEKIIIVGGIIINLLVLYIAKSGKEDKNMFLYKSILISIIAAIIGMFCICLVGEIDYVFKIVMAIIIASYLFVSLPIVIKKINRWWL